MYLFVLFTIRENLKILLKDVNDQKKRLKQEGISVDGKHFSVEFVGKSHSVMFAYIQYYIDFIDHQLKISGRLNTFQ